MTTTLLVRGGHVLTMDARLGDHGDFSVADVLIEDGRIADVGERIDVNADQTIEAHGAIVMPGLVDGHRHVWQSLLRGVASDWSLPNYMIEARALYSGCFDADAAYVASRLGGLESLAAGITTVVDHSHLQTSPSVSESLVRGLLDSGVGAVFCYALQNVPDFTDDDRGVSELGDLLMRPADAWHDANAQAVRDLLIAAPSGLVRFGVALPEAAPYLPEPALEALLTRVRALEPTLVTGHWDGGPQPTARLLAERGEWPDPTMLSHGNRLDEGTLKALATSGVSLCTTPDIECGMSLGSLVAHRFVEMGGTAALGTDLSSYARADMLAQARLNLQAERSARSQPGNLLPNVAVQTRAALDLITRGAAAAIGLEAEIGTLTPGKRADVLVVRPGHLDAVPGADPIASLLFYCGPSEVETVVVAGKVRKHAGQLVDVDLAELTASIAQARTRVEERYRALPRTDVERVWAGLFG